MPQPLKTLLLIRHGHAAWQDAGASDRHRPLDARGEFEVERLRRWAREHARGLQHIASSPAVHALETARALAEGAGLGPHQLAADERLYLGSARSWAQLMERWDPAWNMVALVGHNPHVTDLCRHLAEGIEYLPAGAVAELQFRGDGWGGLLGQRAVQARLHLAPEAAGAADTQPAALTGLQA